MKEQFYVYALPNDDARKLQDFINQLAPLGIKSHFIRQKAGFQITITYDTQQLKQLNQKNPRNAGRPAHQFSIEEVLNYQQKERLNADKIAAKLGVNTATYYRHKRKLDDKYGSFQNALSNGIKYF